MVARAADYIEGQEVNAIRVAAMVVAIDRATAAMEAEPLADVKNPGEENAAIRDVRVKHAKVALAAPLRAALDRFERVAARKLLTLGAGR